MSRGLLGALRPHGRGALALLGILTLSGGAYERVMRRNALSRFPVQGRVVAIEGGRHVQIDCRGAGSPTVVLESGLDILGSLSWMSVHDSMALTTRVCAYSRAGIMWSDPTGARFDSHRAARDLHTALAAAGESSPYLMVAHSIGAAYAMRFTANNSSEVAGLVLDDPSHPDQFTEFRKATGKFMQPSSTVVRVGAMLAWTGLLRMLPQQNLQSWPLRLSAASKAFLPTSLSAAGEEAHAISATLADAGTIRDLGDLPVVVLSASDEHPAAALEMMGLTREQGIRLQAAQHRLHAGLASMSRNGRHEPVAHSSHYIQLDRPDVVISAVGSVVAAIRSIHR